MCGWKVAAVDHIYHIAPPMTSFTCANFKIERHGLLFVFVFFESILLVIGSVFDRVFRYFIICSMRMIAGTRRSAKACGHLLHAFVIPCILQNKASLMEAQECQLDQREGETTRQFEGQKFRDGVRERA